MAIDVLSDRSLSGLPDKIAGAKRVPGKIAGSAEADRAVPADAVMLTDSAKNLSRATAGAKAADGIDAERVSRLKQAVQDGSYKVNYESVANRLLESEGQLNALFG